MSAYRANVWRLYGIRLLFWMHFFSAVLVPFFTDWGGITLAQVFVLNAWFFLCNFLLEVPTGTVADFLGRKTSLVVGGMVAMAGAAIYVSKPHFLVFMVAEAVMAVAYTLNSGADEAIAFDSLTEAGESERVTEVVSRMEAFKLCGIILGTISGGFIASRFGLAAPMAAYVAPAAGATLLALTLREPEGAGRERPGRTFRGVLSEGARYFAGHARIRRLALDAAVVNAVAWGIIWLFQPLLERAGVPIRLFGIVHALGLAAQVGLLANVGRIQRWAGSPRRMLRAGTAAGGVAFAALAVVDTWYWVVPGIVAAMALTLPRVAVLSAAINHHAESGNRATVLSFAGMARQLAIAVVNPIVGYLAQGSMTVALASLGTILVALAAGSRLTDEDLRPPAELENDRSA